MGAELRDLYFVNATCAAWIRPLTTADGPSLLGILLEHEEETDCPVEWPVGLTRDGARALRDLLTLALEYEGDPHVTGFRVDHGMVRLQKRQAS